MRAQHSMQNAAALGYSRDENGQYGYQPSNGYGKVEEQPVHDPLIYQDVYAPSGFDIMSMLVIAHHLPFFIPLTALFTL